MPKLTVSPALQKRHFDVYAALKLACEENGIMFSFAGSTVNIWLRDYMPVAANGEYVKFKYKTVGYLDYPQMRVRSCDINQFATKRSDLVIDGGNVVQSDDFVVLTEMAFSWNNYLNHQQVYDKLTKLFNKTVLIVPAEPGDTLGHADGILQFVGKNKAFVSDYHNVGKAYEKYKTKLYNQLEKAGIEVVPFTYAYDKCPWPTEKEFRRRYPLADDYNPGVGYYVNYLHIGNIIFLPTFGFKEDYDAEQLVKKHLPKVKIIKINCFDLAMTGGLLHCVSWEDK